MKTLTHTENIVTNKDGNLRICGNKTAQLLIKSIRDCEENFLPKTYDIYQGWSVKDVEEVVAWHTSSLTAIIHSEIERKKGIVSNYDRCTACSDYNTAITEDIQYWENVLEELEKNV